MIYNNIPLIFRHTPICSIQYGRSRVRPIRTSFDKSLPNAAFSEKKVGSHPHFVESDCLTSSPDLTEDSTRNRCTRCVGHCTCQDAVVTDNALHRHVPAPPSIAHSFSVSRTRICLPRKRQGGFNAFDLQMIVWTHSRHRQ